MGEIPRLVPEDILCPDGQGCIITPPTKDLNNHEDERDCTICFRLGNHPSFNAHGKGLSMSDCCLLQSPPWRVAITRPLLDPSFSWDKI